MATEKQELANLGNAQKSTGPKTAEGKAKVSQNATRHGLLSRVTVLNHECRKEFEDLQQGIFVALQPAGALESILVDRITSCCWRLRRVVCAENRKLQEIEQFSFPEEKNPEKLSYERMFVGSTAGVKTLSRDRSAAGISSRRHGFDSYPLSGARLASVIFPV